MSSYTPAQTQPFDGDEVKSLLREGKFFQSLIWVEVLKEAANGILDPGICEALVKDDDLIEWYPDYRHSAFPDFGHNIDRDLVMRLITKRKYDDKLYYYLKEDNKAIHRIYDQLENRKKQLDEDTRVDIANHLSAYTKCCFQGMFRGFLHRHCELDRRQTIGLETIDGTKPIILSPVIAADLKIKNRVARFQDDFELVKGAKMRFKTARQLYHRHRDADTSC